MKKILLSITAGLLVSFSLFAQTAVSLTANPSPGNLDDYSGSITSVIPSTYLAKTGDIITVHVAGTANYDLTQLQVVFLDPSVSYRELSGYITLGVVTANTAFDFTTKVVLTADAPLAGSTGIKMVLDGKSQAAITASAASVDLSLTTETISIAPYVPGVTTIPNTGGTYCQINESNIIPTATALQIGDIRRFTVNWKSFFK